MRRKLSKTYQLISSMIVILSPLYVYFLYRNNAQNPVSTETDAIMVIRSTLILFFLIITLSIYIMGIFKIFKLYSRRNAKTPLWIRLYIILISLGLLIPLDYVSLVGISGIVFTLIVPGYSARTRNGDKEPETKVDFGI